MKLLLPVLECLDFIDNFNWFNLPIIPANLTKSGRAQGLPHSLTPPLEGSGTYNVDNCQRSFVYHITPRYRVAGTDGAGLITG